MIKKSKQYFFLLILFSLSLGQLQRFQITPTIALYAHDILISLWLIVSIVSQLKLWKKTVTTFSKYRFLLLMLGFVGVSLGSNQILSPNITQLLYTSRLITYLLFVYSLYLERAYLPIKKWWLIGAIIAWLGFLQYLLIPDTRFLLFLGWDEHYYRFISTLFDPNFTGIILVITLIHVLSIKHKLSIVIILGLLVGIILTFSRATYLSLVIAYLYALSGQFSRFKTILKKNWKPLILSSILIIVATMLLMPDPDTEGKNIFRTYSLDQRIENSLDYIKTASLKTILIGNGLYYSYQTPGDKPPFSVDTAHFPDSFYVFVFSSLGVIGLVLFAIAVVKISTSAHLNTASKTVLLAVAIHSMFNPTLIQPFVLLYLGGLIVSELKSDA